MPVEIKSHKRFILVKISVSIVLSLLAVYLTIFGFLETRRFDFNLEYELKNWESDTIESISHSNKSCSENGLDGFRYMWPGSKDSCDCRFSDEYTLSLYGLKKKVYWQVCTVDMFRSSCKNSKGQNETLVSGYNFDSFLCFGRRKGANFRKSMKDYVQSKQCKVGYVKKK